MPSSSLMKFLPQTAKLSKAVQVVQLDQSSISAYLHMLDAAMEPSANWVLQLVDLRQELATSIAVPDIVAFTESIGKPLCLCLWLTFLADLACRIL